MNRPRALLDYYPLALAEGEGAGTAYEYYVKARLLRRILDKLDAPVRLLIAGLPQRYGFSLDFLLLAQQWGCRQVTVVDERRESLEQLAEICRRLGTEKILNPQALEIKYLAGLSLKEDFDLFLSCEVIQRMPLSARQEYWSSCLRGAKAGVVFAPNAENPAHAQHSKLNTLSLEQLIAPAQAAGGEIIASGYLDLPPFPPGITRSQQQRAAAEQGCQRLAFKAIEQWARMESLIPAKLRRKWAHIVFAAARRKTR